MSHSPSRPTPKTDGLDACEHWSDDEGETPLFVATLHGHEGIVKLLLGRDDINPNKPDGGGQTPLSIAVGLEHWRIVRMLVGDEGLQPNKPGENGDTFVRRAARNGNEEVVKMT